MSRTERVMAWASALLVGVLSTPALGQELGAVEDRLLIAEQLTQYSYRWDGKDAEGFANLFTDDGVLERRINGLLVTGSRVEGRDAIRAYAIKAHEGRLADRQTRHYFSGLVFLELSGDRAVTENMALITHQPYGEPTAQISGSGIYRKIWRRTPEGWRIAERVLHSDRPPQRPR